MSRRDGQANAERIIEATCQLWTREATPSLDAIAQEAGVGIATLYRHFPNRSVLEREAFKRIYSQEILPVVSDTRNESLLDTVERFVNAVSLYTPLLYAAGASQIADDVIDDAAEPFLDLLRRGQDAGLVRIDLEAVDIFWLLRMVILGLTHENSSPAIQRRYLAITLAGISPQNTEPLPPLAAEDYQRLSVSEKFRGTPAAEAGAHRRASASRLARPEGFEPSTF